MIYIFGNQDIIHRNSLDEQHIAHYIKRNGEGADIVAHCAKDGAYQGFAFGVGLERIALLKYEIDDMRLLYENDIRFLNQF